VLGNSHVTARRPRRTPASRSGAASVPDGARTPWRALPLWRDRPCRIGSRIRKKQWLGRVLINGPSKRSARTVCIMQHMRNSAIILAALLMAMPTFAIAQTDSEIDESCPSDARDMLGDDRDPPPKWLPLEQCEKANQEKYADTAHCFLRV